MSQCRSVDVENLYNAGIFYIKYSISWFLRLQVFTDNEVMDEELVWDFGIKLRPFSSSSCFVKRRTPSSSLFWRNEDRPLPKVEDFISFFSCSEPASCTASGCPVTSTSSATPVHKTNKINNQIFSSFHVFHIYFVG